MPNYTFPHGGRNFSALPRVARSVDLPINHMTESTIEDEVRKLPYLQGANDHEMWGFIENEILRWQSNRIGLNPEKPLRRNKYGGW